MMTRETTISRRTALQLTGAAASTTLLAGCNKDNDGQNDDPSGITIPAGTDIRFTAQTSHWEGATPTQIEGMENPLLVLEEGAEYTLGWTDGDGSPHNMEIRDAENNIVNGLRTSDPVSDPGEDQILTFTARQEMAVYRCLPHPSMEGELRVE